MPVEAKPLFRPDVLRAHLAAFELPARVAEHRDQLTHWADDEAALKRFVFFLGAERVVPAAGKAHFYALLGILTNSPTLCAPWPTGTAVRA